MADPIIRKVKDAALLWASKSWPLSGHSEFDAETGKPIRRQVIETVAGPEVVGVAHMLEPERFMAPVVTERLAADDAKRMRTMFHVELGDDE